MNRARDKTHRDASSQAEVAGFPSRVDSARAEWRRAQEMYERAWESGMGHAERCGLAVHADDAYLRFLEIFSAEYGRYPGPTEQ